MLTPQHTYIALLIVQALHLLHHRLTGREGVKGFIREEVSELLGGAIDWEGLK
jgi:hypothetical protein